MNARFSVVSAGLVASLIFSAPALAQDRAAQPQPPAEAEADAPAEAEEEPAVDDSEVEAPPAAEPRAQQARPAPGNAAPPPQQVGRPAPAAPAGQSSAAPAPQPVAPSQSPTADAMAPLDASDPIPAADAPPPVPLANAAQPAEQPRQADESSGAAWLWLLAGVALTLGALGLYRLLRGNRGAPGHVAVTHHQNVAPVAAPSVRARPWVEVSLRPFRAGVDGEAAVVEFELSVENKGSAPARDVRVSTRLFPGGAAQQSEMAGHQIEEGPASTLPGVSLDPGEVRRIATAVSLPMGEVGADSVLPVVFADARYTLPDGSEGRTAVSFAVGMRDGEELAQFATDRPSGLHREVEAWPLGEPERS